MKQCLYIILQLLVFNALAQNGIVGDGFGGRSWYQPTNYSVGSYSGFTVCNKEQNNQLLGWGSNNYGELGTNPGNPLGTVTPVEIPGMSNVKYYTTGYVMAAIKQDNSGWVWGFSNFNYQPTQVINDVKFADASMDNVSFIKNDGTVWSMGTNAFGTFGDLTNTANFQQPVQMQAINNAVRVASSAFTNYILTDEGKVFVCGGDGFTSLGTANPNLTVSLLPVQMANLVNIIDIKATSHGLLALDTAGNVFVFCYNNFNVSTPVQIATLNNIVAISGMCDGASFLALDENKNVYEIDIMGVVSTVATDAIDILAGETFSYIIKSDGSLWGKGGSNGGSIWLNLTDQWRDNYTFIDINQVEELCPVIGNYALPTDCKTIEVFMNQGTPPYQYSIGNGNQNSPIFTDLQPGDYTVTVTDASGIITTLNVSLLANYQNVQAAFSTDQVSQVVMQGTSVEFTNESSQPSDINWYLDGLFLTSDSIFSNTFSEEGTHCIELVAEHNFCTDTQQVCFSVLFEEIQFPNIFTPNNDGNNDLFTLKVLGAVEYKGVILNRWGQLIAEIDQSSPDWDGLYQGKPADDGVYFMQVEYTLIDQIVEHYNGFFHLQR